jgi:hypothetical protein
LLSQGCITDSCVCSNRRSSSFFSVELKAAQAIELLALPPCVLWQSLLVLVRKHLSADLLAEASVCSAQHRFHSTCSQRGAFSCSVLAYSHLSVAAAAHSQLLLLCLLVLVLAQTCEGKEASMRIGATVCCLLLLLLGAQGKKATATNGNAKVQCCRSGTSRTLAAATAHTRCPQHMQHTPRDQPFHSLRAPRSMPTVSLALLALQLCTPVLIVRLRCACRTACTHAHRPISAVGLRAGGAK